MAKNARKTLVLILAFVLCFVQIIPAVMAEESATAEIPTVETGASATPAEPTVTTTTGTSPEGLSVTTTTTTSESGDGTVTVTIEKTTDGTTVDGVQVSGSETTQQNLEDGTLTWETEGSETREWVEEDDGSEPGQTEVSAVLIPGEETSGIAVINTLSGDTPTDAEDTTYDYTETEIIDREVTVTTSEDAVITDVGGDVNLEAIGPDIYTEDGSFSTGDYQLGQYSDGTMKDGIYTDNTSSDLNAHGTMEWDEATNQWVPTNWTGEGDFQYAGYAEQSKTGVYYQANIVYKTDDAGNLVLDEDGNAIIESSGQSSTNPIQFVLHDKDGNIVFAYCIDLETGAKGGHYYDVSNLEDSDYYASEESENHLRAIVLNGYLGAANEMDEDGNYATGSIEAIRATMAEAFAAGEIADEDITITETDDAGNEIQKTVKLSELMKDITEGEALAVTQAAIWTYANGNPDILDGTANEIVVGENGFSGNAAATARLKAYYNYLINLTAEKTETTVIDDETFLKEDSLNLVVGDKASGYSQNHDDDNDNDVYDTSLNFTLAFIPGEKDDLMVCVSYQDLDGNTQTIIKRLAGENDDGENYETIYADENGSYTLSGLTLSENKDFNFDLKLEGVQYLEQGVYIYSPVGGRGSSQTFVSLAEGEREVNITSELTISFDVDENNKITATRSWRSGGTRTRKPGGGDVPDPDDPTIDPDDPNNPTDGDELIIPDDAQVPLADVPQTGDNSIVYALMSLISLCGIIMLAKKRRTT